MSRRFIITGVVIAVLLGGLGYFQFVFKPQMIRTFLSQMRPPPATVTAEAARTEKWVEQLTSIGTLIASQGVDITTQVAGIVTEVLIESGQEVEQGAKLVQLDIAVELADLASAKATLQEAEVAYRAPGRPDAEARDVGGQPRHRARQARHGAGGGQAHRGRDRPEGASSAPFAGRLGIRKVEKGQYVSPGMALVSLQALDPDPRRFPDARAEHRQAARRPDRSS